MSAYGIKETKELIKFIIEFGEAVDASLVDGKIDFGDISNLVAAMLAAGPALTGANLIPAELKDLDQAEALELCNYAKTELGLTSPKIEEIIERAIEIGLKIFELISMLKAPAAPAPAPAPTPTA